MSNLYGGGEVLQSRETSPGFVVELTQDSRGLWLYRVKRGGVPHWRYAEWSALGYRKPADAYAAVERAEREG